MRSENLTDEVVLEFVPLLFRQCAYACDNELLRAVRDGKRGRTLRA